MLLFVMRALFLADWVEVVFLHLRVAPARLQPLIPLTLDLLDGDAYVSLVAFTQKNLRPSLGAKLAARLSAPLASHEFFNVRTYVRAGEDRGIYFLAEWIPNRLACWIGPRMYGLPYRLGRLDYHNEPHRRERFGQVRSGASSFAYRAADAHLPGDRRLDDFLLERYAAFTFRAGVIRRFDVAPAPWPQRPVTAELIDSSLLGCTGPWVRHAQLAAANYSPGVIDVAIGRPQRVPLIALRR